MNPETPDSNEEWNDMKNQWKSIKVDEMALTLRLRLGLKLRMIGAWVWLALEILGLLMLTVLAALQVAMGQMGPAIALGVLTLACLGITLWARRSPLHGASGSLLELLDLTIQRARRGVRFAWANYLTTAACAAYVLVMFFSDIGDREAAYGDGARVTVALVAFALYAAGVAVYHRYALRRVRKFTDLRRAFAAPTELAA